MEITTRFDRPDAEGFARCSLYILALIMKNSVFSFKEESTLSITPHQLFQHAITVEPTRGTDGGKSPAQQADLVGCDILIAWQLLVLIRGPDKVFLQGGTRTTCFPCHHWDLYYLAVMSPICNIINAL